MLIFKGDTLMLRCGVFDLPERPKSTLRCSLDFPDSWTGLTPWCEVDETFEAEDAEWLDLRSVWSFFGDGAFAKVGAAYQYMHWMRHTKFCSLCASPLHLCKEDRGLCCSGCGKVVYSLIVPAVIVAVERDGKLLLAHNTRMPAKRFSVLAGFVEPGETPEQTVAREVMEEVAVEVGDIRYFGSQSWPFPSTLMLGYTAKWKSGEVCPDGTELDEAGWYVPGEMPDLPSAVSISRRLIENFIARHRGEIDR